MQHRQDDLNGRHHLAGVKHLVIDRDATAVVDDRNGVVDVDRNINAAGMTAERLVDRVVDDLIDEVMQTLFACRPDIHGGPEADGRKTFKDGNVFSRVAATFFGQRSSGVQLRVQKVRLGGQCGGCHRTPCGEARWEQGSDRARSLEWEQNSCRFSSLPMYFARIY